ncbi:MAG: hapE 3 [Herminiimonas sp.]|nr:hapE 3 [Herminiimonas sp.]
MRHMFKDAVRDEAQLRAALAGADIAPTCMLLAHLSGDLTLLEQVAPHIRGPSAALESVPEPLKQKVRDRLVEVLKDYAATDRAVPNSLPPDVLQRVMNAGVGQSVPPKYVPLLVEEMQLDDRDLRQVDWRRNPAQLPLQDFKVVVIGAGMSGICAGIKLKEAGISHVILEKNSTVGGTWYENSYPDSGVDTPNHIYSFAFYPNPRWTHYYSKRDQIYAYLEDTTDHFGIRPQIRFNVEVETAEFMEDEGRWRVSYRNADGTVETIECNAVISAVGQLNRPSIPDIKGLKDFKGPCFHTARWDHGIDFKGKRVAMIGTGASAVQAGPVIAPEVERLTIFQRGAHWVKHDPNYHREVSAEKKWALEHIPYYYQWYRFQLLWATSDGFHHTLKIDPDWKQQDVSINEANHAMREAAIEHIRKELDGDETLIRKTVPNYPLYGRRVLRDNYWFRMLKRPNVELVTEPIDHVSADSVVTKDGASHAADVLILATGFQTNRMLWPMDVKGRGGVTIRGLWGDDDPCAYLGVSVPQFPNMFLLYGPKTNLAHGGSIIFHTECQVRYIIQALREMIEGGHSTIEVRQDAHDRYNELVDATHKNLVWAHPGVNSWYKNKNNRVTMTTPWSLLDYWKLTKQFDPESYLFGSAGPEQKDLPRTQDELQA